MTVDGRPPTPARDGPRHAAPRFRRQSARRFRIELAPRRAAVGRLEQTAARTVRRRIHAPRRTARIPERRVDGARVTRIEREIDGAEVVAPEQHLLPRRAAVARTIDAAVRVRAVRMPERGDEDDVGIGRVDDDARDLTRVVEAQVRPIRTGVGGLVHAVAVGDLRPHVRLAGPDINDAGIRRRHRDSADRRHRLRVEDRKPGAARVGRLPDAAPDGSEIEDVDLSWHSGDAVHAPAAERPDQPPAQSGVQRRIDAPLLRRHVRQRGKGQHDEEERAFHHYRSLLLISDFRLLIEW